LGLAPLGATTLATEIWADTSTMAFASAAPYAALMTLLSLFSTYLLAGRFGRVGGAAGADLREGVWRSSSSKD
jgi:iron(III) transport system permease protein